MTSAVDEIGTRVTVSWLERARLQGVAPDAAVVATATAPSVADDSSSQGWDPYDVWLRRIHLPRRRGQMTG